MRVVIIAITLLEVMSALAQLGTCWMIMEGIAMVSSNISPVCIMNNHYKQNGACGLQKPKWKSQVEVRMNPLLTKMVSDIYFILLQFQLKLMFQVSKFHDQ